MQVPWNVANKLFRLEIFLMIALRNIIASEMIYYVGNSIYLWMSIHWSINKWSMDKQETKLEPLDLLIWKTCISSIDMSLRWPLALRGCTHASMTDLPSEANAVSVCFFLALSPPAWGTSVLKTIFLFLSALMKNSSSPEFCCQAWDPNTVHM